MIAPIKELTCTIRCSNIRNVTNGRKREKEGEISFYAICLRVTLI